MELADSSNDSMLGVKDLETKVVSTSLGIELHVWVPVKWEDLESDGDLDETQLIVVGLIKDVSNLRTEGGSKANADGEPSISYEVALLEELSVDHATRLDVARDQKFLVDCKKLWACPCDDCSVRAFLFCGNGKMESQGRNNCGVSATGD